MAAEPSALLAAAAAEGRDYARALRDPAGAQRALLARILTDNAQSDFGREHGFAGCSDIVSFQSAVPVRGYDDLCPWIERVAGGEANVLTTAPVIAFEETGGTASGAKLVPYTAAGLAGFRRAVLPWLDELARRRPGAFGGRVYATISPATRQPRATPGGIAIGLDSDAAYLGAKLAPAFAAMLAVQPQLGRIADPAEWQVATLAALVAAPDLSFVSLWSPTFLLALIEALPPNAEAVLAALSPADRPRLSRALAASRLDTQMLWPQLDSISCWRDGASATFANALAAAFPHAAIEAKGLLATEAAVTVPWGGECLPALTSTVSELLDDAGVFHLVDGAVSGQTYRAIVTTASGLYRYDLGDLVECTGLRGGVPALRFAGRGDATCDLVGEKLEDGFVAGILATLPCPAVLMPADEPPGYILVSSDPLDTEILSRIEAQLSANPQYAHARRIGQLAPLRIRHRPNLAADMTRAALAAGRRMGDVKPVALMRQAGDDWMQ